MSKPLQSERSFEGLLVAHVNKTDVDACNY